MIFKRLIKRFFFILKPHLRLAKRVEPCPTIRVRIFSSRPMEVGHWSEKKDEDDKICGYRIDPNPKHTIWLAYEQKRKEHDEVLDGPRMCRTKALSFLSCACACYETTISLRRSKLPYP